MTNSTLSIFISIIVLTPIAAFAQNIHSRIKTNSNSSSAVSNTNSVIQKSSQTNYKVQLNHNDYSIPISPNAQ